MNSGVGCFWLWLLMLGGTSSRPTPQINDEEGKAEELITVNITEVDRRNIGLAETMGVNSLDITYPKGIQCVLRKVSSSSPGVRCRQVRVPRCRTVQRLKNTNVTEDCGKQAEYCHYERRTQGAQEVTKETIVCERSRAVTCRPSRCPDCPEICHKNPIVVCATEQQKVVITERKQKCGDLGKLETIKICFTYPDASWLCKELRNTEDCEAESVRVVSSEIGMPRIMCSKKEQSPICLPAHCSLSSNDTHCLTTQLPIEVDLEDFECEECSHGRTKERQVLVQEEECKDVIQEFCVDNEDEESEWIKTCRVPSSTQPDQLSQILQEHTNIINDPRSLQPDGHDASTGILFHGPVRDEYIGTKPKNDVPQSDDTITNMIEGADIFFAKQFFKNTLTENNKGHNTNEKGHPFAVTEPTPLTTSQTTRSSIKGQSTSTSSTSVKEYTAKPFVTNSGATTPKPKPVIAVTPRGSTRIETTEEYTTKPFVTNYRATTQKSNPIISVTPQGSARIKTTEEYTTKASTTIKTAEEYTTKASTTAQTKEDYTTKKIENLPPVTTPKSISTKTSTASNKQQTTENRGTNGYTVFTTPNPPKFTKEPLPTFGPIFIPTITTEISTTRVDITTAKNIENESICISGPEVGISCVRSHECPIGQQCISGSCELVCQNDESCPSGKSCVDSKCVDHCSNEEACGVNAQCIHHKYATYCSCIPGFIGIPTPREGCVRSQHSCAIVQCPVGYKCERDHCHYKCQESQDCAVGEICLDQKCAKICRSDEHCLIGEFCSSELICKTGCNEDENCHENQLCLNKKCVTIGREKGFETTTDGVTRFPSRPTLRSTSETTPNKISTNNAKEIGSGSGIYFNPNLSFPGAILDQLTTEGTPTVGTHSGISDPTLSIHPGINNGDRLNSDSDICANIKCPFGYRCEQGECISIRGTNEDEINPKVNSTKDNANQKENNYQRCLNVRCPPGYRCNTGQCYIYNRQNYTEYELEQKCNDVKCPVGYRCYKGDCISIANHNVLKSNNEHGDILKETGDDSNEVQDCINVLCPAGYRCERGNCYNILNYNNQNASPDTPECENVKCPNGYRCERGECVDKAAGSFRDGSRNIDNYPNDCTDVKCPLGYECERGRCVDHDITIDSFDRDDLATNSDHIHNAGTSGEHRHHAHSGRHLNHGLHKHKTRFEKKQDSGADLNDLLLLLGDDITGRNLDKVDINIDNNENIGSNDDSTNAGEPDKSLHQKNSSGKANLQNSNKDKQGNTSILERTGDIQQKENESKDVQNNDQTGLLFLPFTDPLLKRGNNQGNEARGNINEQEGDRSTSGKQQFAPNTVVFNTKDDNAANSKNTNLVAHSEIEDKETSFTDQHNSNSSVTEENDVYMITNNFDNQGIHNSENRNQIIDIPAFDDDSENRNNEETNRKLENNRFEGRKSNHLGTDHKQGIAEGNINGNAVNINTNKVNQMQNSNIFGISNKEVVNEDNNDNNQTTSLLFHPLTEDFLSRTSTELPNQNKQNGFGNEDDNVPFLAQHNNNGKEQLKDNNKNNQQHGLTTNSNHEKGNFNFGNDRDGNNIISEGKFEIHSGTFDETTEKSNDLVEEQKSDQEHNERDINCEHI